MTQRKTILLLSLMLPACYQTSHTPRGQYGSFAYDAVPEAERIPPEAGSTPPFLPSPQAVSFETQVLMQINVRRAQGTYCGDQYFMPQPPLMGHAGLTHAARAHSWEMAVNGYSSHRSLDGRSAADRVRATGYQPRGVGENIARGQQTPTQVVDSWMSSPGHCSNIMDPSYRFVGIGYAYNGVDQFRHYWTQDFAG